MARKTIVLSTGNIYHVVNRGVERRNIFTCNADYYRFIHDLYEFNDENSIQWSFRHNLTGTDPGDIEIGQVDIINSKNQKAKKRKLLVEILAFCLMPNHFHLLLRQLQDGGVSLFMQKMGGYAVYFNKKYERVGSLFQNRYKAVEIETDQQLNNVFSYIHTNPVELVEPAWKIEGVSNLRAAKQKLNSWRWSSFLDYTGKKNFPSVTSRDMFLELFGGNMGCNQVVKDWIKYKAENYENWKDIALD